MRIDRDTVAAKSRTRRKGDEPVGFGCRRCLPRPPDASLPRVIAHDRHLIYQPYVHDPERVLQQLGHLGGFDGRDRDYTIHDLAVQRNAICVTSGVIPPTTRGVFFKRVRRIAGINPLRRKCQAEIDSDLETHLPRTWAGVILGWFLDKWCFPRRPTGPVAGPTLPLGQLAV